jgi:hypothetical protein
MGYEARCKKGLTGVELGHFALVELPEEVALKQTPLGSIAVLDVW